MVFIKNPDKRSQSKLGKKYAGKILTEKPVLGSMGDRKSGIHIMQEEVYG
jgi:hypothetical protein